MKVKSAQLLAVVLGVALILVYSGLMIANEGNAGWSWIILIVGIALLIGGGRISRRNNSLD